MILPITRPNVLRLHPESLLAAQRVQVRAGSPCSWAEGDARNGPTCRVRLPMWLGWARFSLRRHGVAHEVAAVLRSASGHTVPLGGARSNLDARNMDVLTTDAALAWAMATPRSSDEVH